jgi:hypothetical protein
MMNRSRLSLLAAFYFFLSLAPGVRADADTRPATPEEKDFSQKTLSLLAQALPQPLPGFQANHPMPLLPLDQVPSGDEKLPLGVSYSATWLNADQQAKERTEEDEAVASLTAEQQNSGQGKEHSTLLTEQSRLTGEIAQASQRGDMSRLQDLQFQASHVGERLAKINEEQQAAIQAMVQTLPKTSRLTIVLQANRLAWDQPAGKAEDQEPLAGHPVSLWHNGNANHEDVQAVFLGDWQKSKPKDANAEEDPAFLTVPPKSLPRTRVQSVVVSVYGDKDLGRQVLSGINWKSLQQLMGEASEPLHKPVKKKH